IEETITIENRSHLKKVCKEKISDTQQHTYTLVKINDFNVEIDIKEEVELDQNPNKEDIEEACMASPKIIKEK
ncbi:15382_t:CDS:1, partial [Acaulospora colombiana]